MNKIVLCVCFAVVVSMHDAVNSATMEAQQKTEVLTSGKVLAIVEWVKESLSKQEFKKIEEKISDECAKITGEIECQIGWSDELADKSTTESVAVMICIDIEQVKVVVTYIKKILKKTTEEFSSPEHFHGWFGSRKTMEVKKDEVYCQKLTREVTKDNIQCLFSGLKEINTFAYGTSMCADVPRSYQKIKYNPTPEQVVALYRK